MVSFSTILLLKVIPECEEGICSKSVAFLQAPNKTATRHARGKVYFIIG
jgi:hypothetical protein